MTVAENVAYGLRQKRVRARRRPVSRVAEALDMVKMRPLAARKPKQLSGGQQQRVALARALVNRPERAAARRAAWAPSTANCAKRCRSS